MRSLTSFPLAAAFIIVAALGLSGCAAEPVAQKTPATTSDSTPQEESPKAEKQQPVAPGCDAANPLAAQESDEFYSAWDIDVSAETGPTDLALFNDLAGPKAQAAMQSAEVVTSCTWPLYLAGNRITQHTAVLDSAAQADLVASLRNSDFVESAQHPATVFTHMVEDPEGYRMTGPTTIQYAFVDNVWIAILETGKSDYLPSALEALITVNPHLAGE